MPDEWLCVADAQELWSQEPSIVDPEEPLSRAADAILARPHGRNVYVVDAGGKLVGVVSFRSILKAAESRYSGVFGGMGFFGALRELLANRARDVMRKPETVRADTSLRDALAMLRRTRQADLPIVDEHGKLVGELNGLQVLSLAARVLRESETRVAGAR